MKCYRNKEEDVVYFAGDGRNEQESGKGGERNVSRGFPGEMTSDLQNKRECDNLREQHFRQRKQ